MSKNLYIAATGQSDGKTTLSIGLLSSCLKNGLNIGFIKPVGQRYVVVNNNQIDKDSYLMQNVFPSNADIKWTSPIAIPHGFTQNYILRRNEKKDTLQKQMFNCFNKLNKGKDMMLIEGTGHAGVGSVLDLSNARVAKLLDSKVILIAPGGVGNTIDEIMLNKAFFDQEGVEVLGVIVNKVYEEKYEKISELVSKSLANYNIKVLGFIPYVRSLSSPNMFLLREAIKADVINEGGNLFSNIDDIVVGAMTPHYVISHLKQRSLLITPGDREDVILAAISLSQLSPENKLAGIVLSGGIMPKDNIYQLIKKTDIPVLFAREDTYKTALMVSKLMVKITVNDTKKIEIAKNLIDKYVDTDYIRKAI